MTSRTPWLWTAALVWTACASALADELVVGNQKYSGARVEDVQAGLIVFQARGGDKLAKPVAQAVQIRIDDQILYNQAEDALQQGDAETAVVLFRAAADESAGSAPWLKKLIACRIIRAMELSGRTDQAAEQWLAVCDESPGSPAVVALAPIRASSRGGDANARAIALLEARRGRLGDGATVAAVDSLLAVLYRAEGRSERTKPRSNPPTPAETPAVPGNAGAISPSGSTSLPAELLATGKSQLAAGAGGNPELLASGGLTCMRVAVFYPDSEEAPEALYLAGRACEAMHNLPAARRAYAAVSLRYPRNEWAVKASAAAAAMPKE
jgi:hypothetical protein